MAYNISQRNKFNKYDIFIMAIIASLSVGVLGGALQLVRLISILLIPYNIFHIRTSCYSSLYVRTLFMGIIWCVYGFIIFQLSCYTSTYGLFELLYIILYFNLLLSIIRFGRKAKYPLTSMAIGWSICVGITLPLALYELITCNHFSTNSIQTELFELGKAINGIVNKRYAAVFFNNYNEYVTFLSFALPFVYYNFFVFRKLKLQIILFFEVFFILVILLLNASRGGILCFACTTFVFFLFYRKVHFSHKKLLLTVISIVSIFIFVKNADTILAEFLDRLTRDGMLEDKGRAMFYNQGILLLQDSNYFGVGPSGYQITYGYAPHNLWIELLSQYGICVFGIILIVLFRLYRKIFKTRSMEPFLKYSIVVFLPFISVINSGYVQMSFTWLYVASVILIFQQCNIGTNVDC